MNQSASAHPSVSEGGTSDKACIMGTSAGVAGAAAGLRGLHCASLWSLGGHAAFGPVCAVDL